MKKARILWVLLIIMAGALVLAACAADEGADGGGAVAYGDAGTGGAEAAEPANPRDIPDNLPDADFGGADFRILFRNSCQRGNWAVLEPHRMEIYSEEMTGDPINDAVYHRNRAVEERFNVEIVGMAYPFGGGVNEAGVAAFARRAITAGSDDFDMVVSWSTHLAELARDGLFVDWNAIPNIDTGMPWWMQGAMEELTINNRTFLAKSDLIFPGVIGEAAFMVFNQQLVEDFGLECPYVMVEDNRWTLDALDRIVREVGFVDVTGTGVRDSNAVYGFTSDSWGSGFAWMWATGNRVTTRNPATGLPELSIFTERNATVLQRVHDLFYNNEGSAITNAAGNSIQFLGGDQSYLFARGNAVFLSDRVGALLLPEFRAAEFDFGIVPLPKLDQTQERFMTMINEHASIMGIPAFNSNLEMTGTIVEAMSAASFRYVVPAYYEVGLQTRYSRDEESVRMLDLIVDGIVFDFGLLYHIPMWNIYQDILSARADPGTFASRIEANFDRAEAALQRILDLYAEIG